MNDVKKVEDFVIEPKWYLKIRSKIKYRSNRFLATLLLPFFYTSVVLLAEMVVYIAIRVDLKSPIVNDFTLATFIISLVLFYFYTRKKFFTKETQYDSFDLFAYTCGLIGLELKRVLLVPNYEYDFQSLSTLKVNSWFLRRKYKSTDDDEIRKSLKELPRLSFKINSLVDNVEVNRETLTKISDEFIVIGNRIETKTKPRILKESIDKVIELLKLGVVKPKKTSRFRTYLKVKKITFTLVEIIASVAAGCITFSATKDIGVSIVAGLTMACVVPAFIAGLKAF